MGKRPVRPLGTPASTTNPNTWVDFHQVLKGAGDGYGFMCGGGIGCYDLDNALEGGRLKPWARKAVAAIVEPVLYTERSQSGRGVHIFVEAPESRGMSVPVEDGRVERYTFGRFIRLGKPMEIEGVIVNARPAA